MRIHPSIAGPAPYRRSKKRYKVPRHQERNWQLTYLRPVSSRSLSFMHPLFDQQIISAINLASAITRLVRYSVSAYHYDILCNLILVSVISHPKMHGGPFDMLGLVSFGRGLAGLTFLYTLCLLRQPTSPSYAMEVPALDCTSHLFSTPAYGTCLSW